MIDLDEKYINFIKNIISKYLTEYSLYLFGSRAKNNAKKYSDIDLAIDSADLTPERKSRIEIELENSTLPYQVDIVDLNSISEDFKKLIEDSLIKI